VLRLHCENVEYPLTDGDMMKPPPVLAQTVPDSPSCSAPKLWPSSCAMMSAEMVVPKERELTETPRSTSHTVRT
jgi:hypothetical protein